MTWLVLTWKWRRSSLMVATLVLLVITVMWIVIAFFSSFLFGSQQAEQLTSGQISPTVRPVKVEVFYETLCPDSIDFILKQLWPTYQSVASILDLHMIPFGKGQATRLSNGSWLFRCQHGPPECYGNLVQTCALTKYDVSKAFPMIVCMENSTQPEKSGPSCAAKYGLNFDPILKCATSPEGNAEQYKMAAKTLALKPRFVPWIGINNNVSLSIQPQILQDLLKVVCDTYQGPKPPACNSKTLSYAQRHQ